MPIDPYYPGKVAEAALRKAREEQQDLRRNQHQQPGDVQSCLLWKTFGFALVSPVVENLNLYFWFGIQEFLDDSGLEPEDFEEVEEGDPELLCTDYFKYNEAKMVDIDLLWGERQKTILELRLVWMAGGGATDGFYGFVGKAFARNDPNKRILFHVSSEPKGEINVEPVDDDEVFDVFDRTNGQLTDLFEYMRSDVPQNFGNCNYFAFGRLSNQPTFLFALAFFAAREYPKEAQTIRSSLSLTQTKLQLLGKYDDASVNKKNSAARVLCGRDGGMRNLVASYAAERYLSMGERDTTLRWYTKHLEWLVQSLRCEENGDAEGARRALSTFVREGKAKRNKIIFGFDNIETNWNVHAARPLAMGLEKDRVIFPEMVIGSESTSSSLKRKSSSE